MRPLRIAAATAAFLMLWPQAALACGGMVSSGGRAEMLGFEALLRWEGGTEELEVSVGFQTGGEEELAWLMPLPAAPEVSEAEGDLISEAFEITEPPVREASDGEGAEAPAVGAGPRVDVLGRETVRGLRFVTLGGTEAGQVTRWMARHGFAFHDRQKPVLQDYLDRGWVVVAARFVSPSIAKLVPVRFRFATPEPVYPLAITGAGHEREDLDIALFVLTPFRPTSSTYPQRIVRPHPRFGFDSPGRRLELRYSAPLGDRADRMAATPDTWLTRYQANIRVVDLTEDLVLAPAAEQTPIDYSKVLAELDSDRTGAWIVGVSIALVLVLLAIWISVRMARRRRLTEAARMPGRGPGG